MTLTTKIPLQTVKSHAIPSMPGRFAAPPQGIATTQAITVEALCPCRDVAFDLSRLEANERGMDRFVSTFTNKLDAKGRVSVPAPFRAVLERQSGRGEASLYCYPALDAPALDAGGERLAQTIDGLLAGLPDYSDERDELSVALYGDVQLLALDGDGRIVIPESLRHHAGLESSVTFVGLGSKFQIWTPERFQERRQKAREKVKEHRKLFGVAAKTPLGEGGPDGAPSGA